MAIQAATRLERSLARSWAPRIAWLESMADEGRTGAEIARDYPKRFSRDAQRRDLERHIRTTKTVTERQHARELGMSDDEIRREVGPIQDPDGLVSEIMRGLDALLVTWLLDYERLQLHQMRQAREIAIRADTLLDLLGVVGNDDEDLLLLLALEEERSGDKDAVLDLIDNPPSPSEIARARKTAREAQGALTSPDPTEEQLRAASRLGKREIYPPDDRTGRAERATTRLSRRTVTATQGSASQQIQTGLGFNGYRWVSQRDSKVRPLHREFDQESQAGTVFSWSTGTGVAGNRHPGDAYGCRCVAVPAVLPEPEPTPQTQQPPPPSPAPLVTEEVEPVQQTFEVGKPLSIRSTGERLAERIRSYAESPQPTKPTGAFDPKAMLRAITGPKTLTNSAGRAYGRDVTLKPRGFEVEIRTQLNNLLAEYDLSSFEMRVSQGRKWVDQLPKDKLSRVLDEDGDLRLPILNFRGGLDEASSKGFGNRTATYQINPAMFDNAGSYHHATGVIRIDPLTHADAVRGFEAIAEGVGPTTFTEGKRRGLESVKAIVHESLHGHGPGRLHWSPGDIEGFQAMVIDEVSTEMAARSIMRDAFEFNAMELGTDQAYEGFIGAFRRSLRSLYRSRAVELTDLEAHEEIARLSIRLKRRGDPSDFATTPSEFMETFVDGLTIPDGVDPVEFKAAFRDALNASIKELYDNGN